MPDEVPAVAERLRRFVPIAPGWSTRSSWVTPHWWSMCRAHVA